MTALKRNWIRKWIDENTQYDHKTVTISRDGSVSAVFDPNKVPGCDFVRRFIGYADDIYADAIAK